MLIWVLILGGCGLVAGIWGPIRFNPTFQMGPLIGVFMTGPLGALLGVAGYFVSRWLQWPMSVQWRVIAITALALVISTILSSFPASEFKAFIVNSTVANCRPVHALREELLTQWQGRVDNIKSAEPAEGWHEQMRATIDAAHGFVIDARVVHRTEIRVNRKPWNRGTLSVFDRTKSDELISFVDYDANATCAQYAPGTSLETFIDYASTRPASNHEAWPPTEIDRIVARIPLKSVPTDIQQFVQSNIKK